MCLFNHAAPGRLRLSNNLVTKILAFWPGGIQIYACIEKESENILWGQIDSVMLCIKVPKNQHEVNEWGMHGGPY